MSGTRNVSRGPGIRLVDCPECDASTSTVALCRSMRCPQCDEPLAPCPACGQWFRPFDGTVLVDCCEHCGVDRWVIVGLRRGDRTLKRAVNARIKGIREVAVVAAWREVEQRIDRGPREQIVAWLDAKAAELEGER